MNRTNLFIIFMLLTTNSLFSMDTIYKSAYDDNGSLVDQELLKIASSIQTEAFKISYDSNGKIKIFGPETTALINNSSLFMAYCDYKKSETSDTANS